MAVSSDLALLNGNPAIGGSIKGPQMFLKLPFLHKVCDGPGVESRSS